MNCIGTYDGTIFYNPANKFCIVSVKTADQSVPAEARSNRRYKDHLIRFTAVGYEIPRTDAVELELDGEWTKGKYGVQLQVEQWREIVPRTKNGVEGYLASGLIVRYMPTRIMATRSTTFVSIQMSLKRMMILSTGARSISTVATDTMLRMVSSLQKTAIFNHKLNDKSKELWYSTVRNQEQISTERTQNYEDYFFRYLLYERMAG